VRCSEISASLGEPLAGTATQARGYVCVEDGGPWGAKAIAASGRPELIELEQRAAAEGVRVLLVREPGSRRSAGRIFLASFASGQVELIHDDPTSITNGALGSLAGGEVTGGQPFAEPIYLVCVNGRRDACCALRGPRVARALAERVPGRVFECTHLGGHRFAANLLALPSGLVFGRLDPASALELVGSIEAGMLGDTRHLRGNAALTPLEQAADAFLRTRLGEHRLDAVRVLGSEGNTERADVSARVDGSPVVVSVERSLGDPRPISCGAEPEPTDLYDVVGASAS
jgi:hypothetical protein